MGTVKLRVQGKGLPETIDFCPDPAELGDKELLFVAAICIQKLAQRHSLEKALELVNEAGYGRLPDGDEFDLLFIKN